MTHLTSTNTALERQKMYPSRFPGHLSLTILIVAETKQSRHYTNMQVLIDLVQALCHLVVSIIENHTF